MSTGASESVFAIRRLICAAGAHGLSLDEGPSAGEPAFHARVSLDRAHELRARVVRELGPALPLAVAGAIEEHLCLLQLAAMACRTIGEVVQLTVARWRYVTEAFPARLIHRTGAVELQLDVAAGAPLGVRVGVEYLLVTLLRAGRELSGGAWQPRELVLGHRPPVPLSEWEAVCGVPVRIADAPGLVIDQSSLAQPVCAQPSRSAGAYFREMLDWCTPDASPSLSARVAAALGRDLRAVTPTVEQVAVELGLSARSLHRQLAAERTSYQRVLDELRCNEAIRQAADERRPFKVIASAVGFADPRAFRRAFKRWTGTSPRQFRLRAQRLPSAG